MVVDLHLVFDKFQYRSESQSIFLVIRSSFVGPFDGCEFVVL